MRVLDIDLDFFLADCCPLAEKGERPALAGHEPWTPEQVEMFLRENCGLSEERPVPGVIFETHDQALVLWERLIREGRLTAPFHVTHIDAHSDLGIGHPGPGFVLYNVISMPPERRLDYQRFYDQQKLDEANYLLFALAMRRVSSLDNVRNPKSHKDIPQEVLDPEGSGDIRLMSLTSRMFEGKNGPEPRVPFHVYNDWRSFRSEEPYDFVSVAISPRYAPVEADGLLPVFRRFMKDI